MIRKLFGLKAGAVLVFILGLVFLELSNPIYAGDMGDHKTVLVINSYSQGFMWTKDETDGIIDSLRESGGNISILSEDMDWKDYPTNENLQHLREYYEYKYKDVHIDMIVATDDAALKFALANRKDLFSNAPVVFCGVNQDGVKAITAGYKNYTGVLEEVDPTETIKMALKINPELKTVYLLFDNSESGISTGRLAAEKIRSMGLNTVDLNNLTHDELMKNAGSYGKDSIILATTYYSDVTGEIYEFDRISRELSSVSSVPVYHLYDMALNNGAFGGVMLSGNLQGTDAAKLAVRILNGESADSIPVLAPLTTRKVIDFQQMQRFDISADLIPKDAEVINKPFSFFETYKTLVLGVIAVFFVLVAFVCVLIFNNIRVNRMKKRLSESHEELTQIYEELTASDEELRQQFDEVSAVQEKLTESEEKYRVLAYHDSLTGLMNKLSLFENTGRAIFAGNSRSALLFVDLDDFKYINDTMGHAFGDQLIIEVGKRLTSLLKEGCSLYRLGGDEFVILFENAGTKGDFEAFAVRILAGFKEGFNVMNSMIHITLSIGIAMYPEHGRSMEELLKNADIAMYKAKESGRNRYVVYERQMDQSFTDRANIERYMHDALDKNEFELYYQPQLNVDSNGIIGLEALLRWKSPELGMIPPSKFIRVAEDTHLIIPLGAWVLSEACSFMKELHAKGFKNLSVSVNISILQLLQLDFVDMVTETLERTGLEPVYLELEITESTLMESFEAIAAKLYGLRELGVRIALDDFGKGYSSLSYLKQLPISTLKLDKSFVDAILADDGGDTLTGHIVMIGNSMGLCVIAEGVERREQLEYLCSHGCHLFQGFLYSEPLPAGEILKLLYDNCT